jgi:peptidoglycan/xylan/chitin deacetylase (PgdA/CDA1 family)
MTQRFAVLMYHDVAAGQRSEGYAVGQHQLTSALDAATAPGPVECEFTFDDGFAGTFRYGLPLLRERRIRATVFPVADFVGRPRYMDAAMLRAWLAEGHRVGSHGMTHWPLTMLPEEEARAEMRDSKARLEDIVGGPVEDFAFPGGNETRRLQEVALESGYSRIYTAEPALARSGSRVLPRFAVRAGTPIDAIRSLRLGKVPRAFLTDRLLWTAKRALGTRLYLALREHLLVTRPPKA